jgi:hypothetical protein
MPSTLVTTAGATDANAYVSRAEATAIIDNLPLAASRLVWTAAATADQDRAILYATVLLDRAFQWVGTRVTTTQALEWPRYVYSTYYGWSDGGSYDFSIDSTTIPERVKQATAEYARQLLDADRTADASTTGSAGGIKKLKADVIEIEYFDSGGVTTASKPVPDAVALLLAGLGFLAGTQRTVPLVRV